MQRIKILVLKKFSARVCKIMRNFYILVGVFLVTFSARGFESVGGRMVTCAFQDCRSQGWDSQYNNRNGQMMSARGQPAGFQSSDIFVDGWYLNYSDGSNERVQCNSRDCLKQGWETQYSTGERGTTRCERSDCEHGGWSTTIQSYSGGMPKTRNTSCNSKDCFHQGWTTMLSEGGIENCYCQSGDCLKYGFQCF